jgi:hypothetical protein
MSIFEPPEKTTIKRNFLKDFSFSPPDFAYFVQELKTLFDLFLMPDNIVNISFKKRLSVIGYQ